MSEEMEIVSNIHPNVFWVNIRTRGSQASICVRIFTQFTVYQEYSLFCNPLLKSHKSFPEPIIAELITKVAEDPEPLSANNDPEGQESHKQLHQSRGRLRELYDVHSAQEQMPMTLFMALS